MAGTRGGTMVARADAPGHEHAEPRGGDPERLRRQRPAAAFALTAAWRDLVWRGRRWAIAAVGTSLAFAITLLLSGFLASFHGEIRTTLDAIGGEGFVVREGAAGPFTTPSPLGLDRLAELQADPGLTDVAPLITLPYTLQRPGDDEVVDVFLVGLSAEASPRWPLREGRVPAAAGEVVLDTRSGADLGDMVDMGDRPFRVVGTTSDVHVLAGKGAALVTIEDAQALLFNGAPFVSGFLVEGRPSALPADMSLTDSAGAKEDLIRIMRPVVQSIETFRLLMWLVAAAVVGSVLYLTAVDRVRDFAVLKATGARNRDLAASLFVQAAALAVVASIGAIVLALLLAPTFPTPVLFTSRLFLGAPLVALVIGAAGSLAGVRRAMTTDPAAAFGAA